MVKEKFIKNLIKCLNEENKDRVYYDKKPLDICYMVSVVDQNIDKCEDFIKDITEHEYEIGYIEDNTEGYTNGKINILIAKPKEERESDYLYDAYYDYAYEITFIFEPRDWGYCECTPEDEGYNKEHRCCGKNCDWDAPAFEIKKIIDVGNFKWEGLERDYWAYEDKFKEDEINKNKEVEKYKKQQKIKSIRNQISRLQQELVSLNV